MKTLTFKIMPVESETLVLISEDLQKLPCRISIDFVNFVITATDVQDKSVNYIFDLINNYFKVEQAYIDSNLIMTSFPQALPSIPNANLLENILLHKIRSIPQGGFVLGQ